MSWIVSLVSTCIAPLLGTLTDVIDVKPNTTDRDLLQRKKKGSKTINVYITKVKKKYNTNS